MPWRIRRVALLVIFASLVLGMSVYVYVANDGAGFDVLASIGLVGGLAILVVALPSNGEHSTGRRE